MEQWNGIGGHVVTVTGPMFAEKSGELIKEAIKYENYGGKCYKAFKPMKDDRFGSDRIVSRLSFASSDRTKDFKLSIPAENLPEEIDDEVMNHVLSYVKDYDIFVFDEAQLYKGKIVELMLELFYEKKLVMIGGLNLSYEGLPYGKMGDLMAISQEVISKVAFCANCHGVATHTQRLLNGSPAPLGERDLIGDKIKTDNNNYAYEPRCSSCFVPPHKVL